MPRLNMLRLALGLALPLLAAAAPAMAQGPAPGQAPRPPSGAAAAQAPGWTAERMRQARPMPAPRLKRRPLAAKPPQAAEPALPPGIARGAPAFAGESSPRLEQPFPPDDAEPAGSGPRRQQRVPQEAVSDEDLVYTPSRVFPKEALRVFPYRSVGKLFFSDDGEDFECSGALIGPRLVVTAGHCVWDVADDEYHTDFEFIPAYDRGSKPYGGWDYDWVLVAGSYSSSNDDLPVGCDCGLLVLKDRRVDGRTRRAGDITGWLGWQTAVSPPQLVTELAYPSNLDKGERMQQTMAVSTRAVYSSPAAEIGTLMANGSSGGPWIQNFGVKPDGASSYGATNRVIGIKSYFQDGERIGGSSLLGGEFSRLVDELCKSRYGGSRNCR